MLVLNMISFSYGESSFFDSLDLTLEPGKLHTLQGRNGCGKSTLFGLIRGELKADAGSIELSGDVASVPQSYDSAIAGSFSFEENLRFALLSKRPSLRKLPSPANEMIELAKRFGVDTKRRADRLSGGQRQLLAIAMVLQRNPSLLLLDEPTAALDSEGTGMIFSLLQELAKRGLTLFVICHDPQLIEQYATGKRVRLVNEGGRRLLH